VLLAPPCPRREARLFVMANNSSTSTKGGTVSDLQDPPPEARRQLPGLDAENRFYWTAGARGRLEISACGDCGTFVHPPRPRCSRCGGAHMAPAPVSGRARVASYTVNRQKWVPGLAVPYVFAVVELEEQAELYVFTNIVGCPAEAVTRGMPVEVVFEQHEDVWLPMFQPRGTGR
jgi:uncharacterized OB-fold protein